MGRELRRVPLNFSWPLNQVWKGYINPYNSIKCSSCDGMGYSPEYKKLQEMWYGHNLSHSNHKAAWCYNLLQEDVDALLKADRLWDFTRVARNDKQREDVKKELAEGRNSWLKYNNGYRPSAEEVNAWSSKGFGHDSCNCYIVIKAKCKSLGLPENCKHCKGTGEFWQTKEIKNLHDDWKDFNPPKGRGFQLWETTTEGSPQSPVFKTVIELAEWCEDNANTFGSATATKEEWLKMFGEEFIVHKEGDNIFI